MNEPKRLVDESDELTATLLRAALQEAPPPGARERVRRALAFHLGEPRLLNNRTHGRKGGITPRR